ncbi:histone-fold-containing protein [Ephemerocybe angulata]|uniref:DNA polymerase epsilon subunit D n=1 Tax=Ephemerocybe angulata TaxID=980116 RepID=A0A8H6HIQ4_9AGAR|nr:histone-fold-containing protein [Tulosesus angulatus]
MPRKENPGPISAQAQQELVSEGIENYELPKSIVMKIAKSALPEEARLTKETVLSLVKGSTVFINYLAATAHDVALSKQHKSIAASDVLKALELVDFGDLVDPLTEELKVYKDTAKSSTKKPRRDSTAAAAPSASTAGKSFSISIPAQVPVQTAPNPLTLKVPKGGSVPSNSASASASVSVSASGTPSVGEVGSEDEDI